MNKRLNLYRLIGDMIMALNQESINKMKELIEAKKQSGNKNRKKERPESVQGKTRKAIRNKKTGGVFDK